MIWLACTPNCAANSNSVFSALIAANATFALKVAVLFRRGGQLICSPHLSHLRLATNRTSTNIPVRIYGVDYL
jgi:hypothetical protein